MGGIVLDTGYAHRFSANSLENGLFGLLGNVGWAHFRTGARAQMFFLGSVPYKVGLLQLLLVTLHMVYEYKLSQR